MAPTLARQTAEALASTVDMVRLIDQKDRKVQARFRKVCDGLRSGIDHGSEDEIALYRPQLADVGAQLDDGLNNVQGALHLLAQLRADKALMEARFEQIEKLLKTVAAVRKRFSDQAMKALMKTTAWVDAEAAKHAKAARAAWEKKDQKALTTARKALIDLMPIRDDVSAMKPRVEAYRKAHPDLDRERKAEVQAMVDDLERAGDTMARVDRVVRELVALGQVPKEAKPVASPAPKLGHAEVDKIVIAFGLDAGRNAGLRAQASRIVNAFPFAKWPKELAKLYGAKEAELKAKIGNLMKLPFVRPMALIDI